MAVTDADKATDQISGECASSGPKKLKTDDDGVVIVRSDNQ